MEEISPEKDVERVWLVHSDGYCAATLVGGQRGGIERLPSEDISFGTDMRDERCKIQLLPSRMMVEVDAGDIEKVSYDMHNTLVCPIISLLNKTKICPIISYY